MKLNPVEMLLLGAAVSLVIDNPPDEQDECPIEEIWALHVIHIGMQRLGYRYRPGVLVSPMYPWFYAALAGVDFLRAEYARTNKM